MSVIFKAVLSDNPAQVSLKTVAEFLDEFLAAGQYQDKDDPNGIYWPSDRSIQRIGLILEPWPELTEWVDSCRLDALFVHRPWTLEPQKIPSDIGILSYHLAFDEHLTLGFNPRLAGALGMKQLEVLGRKEGRAIGMIGQITPPWLFGQDNSLRTRIDAIFGGCETVSPPLEDLVSRVAVVGAINEALVWEAANREAQVYITGQWRQPAQQAVIETGIGVIAIGHHRSEVWGLKTLARILQERWTGLEIFVQ